MLISQIKTTKLSSFISFSIFEFHDMFFTLLSKGYQFFIKELYKLQWLYENRLNRKGLRTRWANINTNELLIN